MRTLEIAIPQTAAGSCSAELWPRQALPGYGVFSAAVGSGSSNYGLVYKLELDFFPGVGPEPDAQGNYTEEQLSEIAAIHAEATPLLMEFINADGSLSWQYRSGEDSHLRIYGMPGIPGDLVRRYGAKRPPTEYDWGLLSPQKVTNLGATDLGDIPEMLYLNDDGDEIARRTFEFSYATDSQGSTELTVIETPAWCRNDGTWVDGPTKTQVYRGQRYNEWRSSARKRIWEALKTWLPRVLVALGEPVDVPAGETLSGGWFGANHASSFALYLESGRKELITASLTNDSTTWLSSVVPDDVVPGLASGKTVREMILEALR